MAAATHLPTKLLKAQGAITSGQAVNLSDATAGNFEALIVEAGTAIPNTTSTGVQFVADVTAANAEVSWTGYARQALTGITWAFDSASGVVDWSFSQFGWAANANDPGNVNRYIVIYWKGVGTADASYPVVAVIDPGGVFSVATASYNVAAPAGGLIQFTGGG